MKILNCWMENMRPIDADAYKQKIKDAYEKLGKEEQTKPRRYLTIEDIVDIEMDCIDHVPTVDSVVHGHWIPFHSTAAGDIQYCSQCEIGNADKTDYCPHCGADMRGDQKCLNAKDFQ